MTPVRYLTLTDAAALMGVPVSTLRRRCAAGEIPGALRIGGPRTPWRIPAPSESGPTPEGVEPRRSLGPMPSEDRRSHYVPTPPTHELMRHAASAAHILANVSTTRPARAASALILDVTAAAARHELDRDGRCAHCGWAYPCPDRRDLTAALAAALAELTDGGTR